MATTKDLTVGGTQGASIDGLNKIFVLHRKIDFSLPENQLGAGDTAQVLNVPAGFFVLKAGHNTIRAEGGTAAGTLGDGSDPDGYVAASNLNSTGFQSSALALTEGTPNTVAGYSNGKFYADADTIDYVATNALDNALVDFWAVVIDCNP
jgi:hypothetical protein